MKKLKIVGIVILALVVISILVNSPKKTEAPTEAPTETTNIAPVEVAPAKQEVEILQFDETLEEVTGARVVHVRIKNNSNKLITYLDLKSIYTSNGGQIVGTGIGNATNIAGGATKVVDVLAMGVENAKTYNVELGNVIYK